MNEKVKNVLDGILEKFRTKDVPAAVAFCMFPIPDVPCAKWSLLNRTIMFFSGTYDARGYRQWQEVDRHVRKGCKAFYILVPRFSKIEDDEDKQVLTGFLSGPVFRFEDTDGAELDYAAEFKIPDMPLVERAEEWGVSVRLIPGTYSYYGYYSPGKKEIALASKEETIFFHELSHVAHEKVKSSLKAGQDPFQEIVAELSAQALCCLVGKKPHETLGNSYRYIERYAGKIKMSPYSACIKVLSETEKVLGLILKNGKEV